MLVTGHGEGSAFAHNFFFARPCPSLKFLEHNTSEAHSTRSSLTDKHMRHRGGLHKANKVRLMSQYYYRKFEVIAVPLFEEL